MKFMEVVAPVEESKEVLDFLQMKGVIELKEMEETEGISSLESGSVATVMAKYKDTAATALDILDKYAPEKAGLLSKLNNPPELTKKEYD
jgi:V/A-type H+-transporting ATPase subunit I